MPFVADPLEVRLLARLDKSGECWIDTKAKNRYGRIKPGGNVRVGIGTHVAAYLLWKGDIPEGLFVCHTCDVPQCCNPDHLFLGTAKDNANDRDRKGRTCKLSGPERWNYKHGKYASPPG
ncbi:HNH endonuclease signature motif containing protein [Streptomyces sp. NPDC056210]|uniref:HNH endonuclease signature motif containing protein n=1 Tax=Streptomyces sp. NPDC056210 TaxID=3345746 RepID=UPI0035DFC2C0